MSPVKLVLCSCSQCVTQKCIDEDGQQRQGQFQSRRVQLNHFRADLQVAASERSLVSVAVSTAKQPEEENLSDLEFERLQLDGAASTSKTVVTLVTVFLGWLHLFCGLSQTKCRLARDYVIKILLVVREFPILDDMDHCRIPKDIRTTLKNLGVAPKLESYVCCPACFSLYDISSSPWSCTFKKTSKARECGEQLFKMKNLYRGLSDKGRSQQDPRRLRCVPPIEIGYPRNVYITQKLSSWLCWLLSKSTIEDEIQKYTEHLNQSTGPKISDIQQSSAWRNLAWPTSTSPDSAPIHLVFSLFIDWFNPRRNKQNGKQQSMGVLAFNCLNLPPGLRTSVENTCVAGIVPGPNMPDMVTVPHIFKNLIDDLLELDNGSTMATYRFPNGRKIHVKLIALLGDMVGMHKAAGYASHSGTFYCSWCWARNDQMKSMERAKIRTKEEVTDAANRFKAATTLDKKDQIFKENGVRWSEFNRLSYRDPVMHLPLGIMHNWFEGILAHHFRYRWGFVLFSSEQKRVTKKKRATMDVQQNARKRVMYEEGGGNAVDKQESEENSEEQDDGDDSDSEYDSRLKSGWDGGLLSKEDILFFRKKMTDVVFPKGVTRLPPNLGESSHGTLKAAQWHSLFAYAIPLIVSEMYAINIYKLERNTNRGQILLNIAYLCQCTNIVCAKTVSERDAELFEMFYKKYHLTSARIFDGMAIKPNHHYALHIPEMIRLWGPLYQVGEFSGERLIGTLQKIQTNSRLAEMNHTLMSRFGQLQRLMANNTIIEEMVNGNEDQWQDLVKQRKNKIEVDRDEYEALLAFVQNEFPNIRDHRQVPHPPDSTILQPFAVPKRYLKVNDHVAVSCLKPNNCIQYNNTDGKKSYGMVQQIYEYFVGPISYTALLINPIENLFPKDLQSPTKFFRYVLFLLNTVVGLVESDFVFLDSKNVTCVCAYRLLAPDTFDIVEGGIVLRPLDPSSQLTVF